MTDQELIRACAEKVMGWEEVKDAYLSTRYWYCGDERKGTSYHPHDELGEWNPLLHDDANCQLLDKVNEHHIVHLFRYGDKTSTWLCQIGGGDQDWENDYTAPTPEGRRRAIVLAALKACGVEV